MARPPAGWTITEVGRPDENHVTYRLEIEIDSDTVREMAFGCAFCGRSTKHDSVEICETYQRVVHSDCHTDSCSNPRCSYVTCNEERCDTVTECIECGELVCAQHRGDQTVETPDGVAHGWACI